VDRGLARGLPAGLLTDAPAHLVASPDVDVIVELMGGDEPAHTLIAAALAARKHVVTANKHVIAHHGPELESIARRTGAALRFEAAVAGGIPILGPLAADLSANTVQRIRGIVNGTTNLILTSMAQEGRPYEEVLAEAQANGFAEADPRGDVEGDDAVNKLVLLTRLGFGAWLDPASILRTPPTVRGAGRPGITGVTSLEVEAAGCLGLEIKLLVVAEQGADPGSVAVSVLPTAIEENTALGGTDGVLNRVEVVADPVGDVAFSGPGAGGDPTSSAILGDLVLIARGVGSTWAGLPTPSSAHLRGDVIDPLAEPRAWFALLPGIARDEVELGRTAAIDEIDGGVAVRTGMLSLAQVRSALRRVLPDGVDATLYPVAE
jgi:homoserine dehydrogenase